MKVSQSLTLALGLVAGLGAAMMSAQAQQRPMTSQTQLSDQSAQSKLIALGYPRDMHLAVMQWRTAKNRQSSGALTTEEEAALLAEPLPKVFAALAGDATGAPGVVWGKATRDQAESAAIAQCQEQGGGKSCSRIYIAAGNKCLGFAGFIRIKDGQRTRVVGTSPGFDPEGAVTQAMLMCRSDVETASLCMKLTVVCADGRHTRNASR